MKTKDFSQKLVLNKSTVANLEKERMNGARGGIKVPTDVSCVYTHCGETCPALSCLFCHGPSD